MEIFLKTAIDVDIALEQALHLHRGGDEFRQFQPYLIRTRRLSVFDAVDLLLTAPQFGVTGGDGPGAVCGRRPAYPALKLIGVVLFEATGADACGIVVVAIPHRISGQLRGKTVTKPSWRSNFQRFSPTLSVRPAS